MTASRTASSHPLSTKIHASDYILKDSDDTDNMEAISIAVLDDYQGISEPKFMALNPGKFVSTFFKDTLRPYNHPDTTQDVKDKLVSRLEPFQVIGRSPSPPRQHSANRTTP